MSNTSAILPRNGCKKPVVVECFGVFTANLKRTSLERMDKGT